jgi:hypothetical protein
METGTGAYTLSDGETLTGGTYDSTNDDENAIRAEGDATATLQDATVEKTAGSASSNDASSFYGLNAAILALDNADLTINGGTMYAKDLTVNATVKAAIRSGRGGGTMVVDDGTYLLHVAGNTSEHGWGTAGANGVTASST